VNDYHAICCMDGKTLFSACQTPRSIYLIIFNTFRVIRWLSQCKSMQKSLFLPILVSPGDAPGAITLSVVWMEREFSACQTPRSMFRSIFNSFPVSQLFEPQVQKSPFSRTPAHIFCFPWRRPCDYHAICCMDGKTM